MRSSSRLFLFCALLCTAFPVFSQEQQFAHLGDFKLESGEVLRDCRIGYRTFGQLSADKSNVILLPTWAGGTTEQLVGSVGAGKLADSSKYFVILVDALSNGVSSSPSNSQLQPHMQFPKISFHDMIATQHALLTKFLHIDHVKAVMGISMGGMQTFQWMVQYPDFMDKAIPIVGSPRVAPYDLVQWQAQLDAIEDNKKWNGGDYTKNPARDAEYEFGAILLKTPQEFNKTHTRDQVFKELAKSKDSTEGSDSNNKIRQVEAMMSLNVAAPLEDSLEKAAAQVKAKALVIVGKEDHTVTPGPAIEFAHLLHADLVVIDDGCGHQYCDYAGVAKAVAEFMEK
jgi:homoserine O-acetyltransferase/O-succinyltransferase